MMNIASVAIFKFFFLHHTTEIVTTCTNMTNLRIGVLFCQGQKSSFSLFHLSTYLLFVALLFSLRPYSLRISLSCCKIDWLIVYLYAIQDTVDESSALCVQDIATRWPPPDVFKHDVIVLGPRFQAHAAVEAAKAVCVACHNQFKHSVSILYYVTMKTR